MPRGESEVVVVGAGAAGLYAALCAADAKARVRLVSATPLAGASSYWAQGGLAAALAPDDSPELHLADTIAAGRGAVRASAARVLTTEAPHAVEHLTSLGVAFDTDRQGRYVLGLEGGHTRRRIVHAGGAATGRRIIRQLSALCAEHARIEILENRRVTEISTRDGRTTGVVLDTGESLGSPAVILATGGAAALWARTTNPAGATGTGLLLAHAAGAALADLELMQFHPTAVVGTDGADGFLVTEAIRGEGARLLDATGERFVDELLPRDEVARAVDSAMRRTDAASVGLDMRDVDPALFPNVVTALRHAGIDPERELVPVAPAAHYMMGGIATDLDGRSTLPGLFAVGECSCTGLHGANRLASNSLSECFVFGARAARAALADPAAATTNTEANAHPGSSAPAELPMESAPADSTLPRESRQRFPTLPGSSAPAELPMESAPADSTASRRALWRHAGLVRDPDGLRLLLGDSHPLVRLIAASALARRESRGAHLRTDFTDPDPALDDHHTVVAGDAPPSLVALA